MRSIREKLATEDTVERELVRRVKAMRGIAIKVMLIPGFPDRIALLPGGRAVFFELKRPVGGKFEPLQPWWLKKLRSLGFKAYVCKTKEEVRNALEEATS